MWSFLKSSLLILASAFVVGCAWGACKLGVALVESALPR
jgi:hypothetical protein